MKNSIFIRLLLSLFIFMGFSINSYALDNIEFYGNLGPDDYNNATALDMGTISTHYELEYYGSNENENEKHVYLMDDTNWKRYGFSNDDYTDLKDDYNFTLDANELIFPSWRIKYLRELNASDINPDGMTIFTDTTAKAYALSYFQSGDTYDFYEQKNYQTLDEILEDKVEGNCFQSGDDNTCLSFEDNSEGTSSGLLVEYDRDSNSIVNANAGTWEIIATAEYGDVILTQASDTDRYHHRRAYKVEDGVVWEGEYNEHDNSGIMYRFNQAGHDQFMSFIEASQAKKTFAGHIDLNSSTGTQPIPQDFTMLVMPAENHWHSSLIIDVNSSGDFNSTLSVNNENDYDGTFPVVFFMDINGNGMFDWNVDRMIMETTGTLSTLNYLLESINFIGSVDFRNLDMTTLDSLPQNVRMQVRPNLNDWQNTVDFNLSVTPTASNVMEYNSIAIVESGIYDDNVTMTIYSDINNNHNWDGNSGEIGCDGQVSNDISVYNADELPITSITTDATKEVVYQAAVELFGLSFKSQRDLVKVEDNNSVLQITGFEATYENGGSHDFISTGTSAREFSIAASLESNSSHDSISFDIRVGTELVDENNNRTYVDILLGASEHGVYGWVDNDRMDHNTTDIYLPDFNASHEHIYSLKWNDDDSIDFFVDSILIFTSQIPAQNYSYIRPRKNEISVQGIGQIKVVDANYADVIYPLIPNCNGEVDNTVDSDGDGIPDSVENQYPFLDAQRRDDGGFDEDEDGLTNLEEYQLGLNFTVVNSILFLNHTQTIPLVFNSSNEEHNISINIDNARGGELNLSVSTQPADLLDINQRWGSNLNQAEYRAGELTLSLKSREGQSGDANVTILLQDTLGNEISSRFEVEAVEAENFNPAIIMYLLN